MFVQTFRRVSYVTRAVYRIFFSSCADPDWDRTAHISRHTRSHAAPQGRCTRQVCVLTWGRTLRIAGRHQLDTVQLIWTVTYGHGCNGPRWL